MEIQKVAIKVKDIFNGYIDNGDDGVFGYDGKLNIRPPFQREFVYDSKKQESVIETIMRGLPLNTMYWGKNDDGTFELIDGQQRTISICNFLKKGGFSVRGGLSFYNMTTNEQNKILNYELDVYICEGSDNDRLAWFRTINIASVQLTEQELLNANYTGSWLADAKRKFSKKNCDAINTASYDNNTKNCIISGNPIRQEILELALTWIVGKKENIADYMSVHQGNANANELWLHFCKVIDWVKVTFPTYRKEMKGLDWGKLYAEFGNNSYDIEELEQKISALMADEEVTSNKGVYEYVLSNCTREKVLSVRAFSDKDKRTKYEQQNGICPICGKHFEIEEMQGDHIVEWSNGGRTTLDNLQMVCHSCHKELTNTMRD